MALPPELLLQIFRWATWPPPAVKFIAEYTPFAECNTTIPRDDPSTDLNLKYNLVLLSRQCRSLATEFLYEHIVFTRPREDAFDIVPSAAWLVSTGYGRYASSVHICSYQAPIYSYYDWAPILCACPNIKLAMRPSFGSPRTFRNATPSPNPIPDPTSITRLEWEYSANFNVPLFRTLAARLPHLHWLSLTSLGTGAHALHPTSGVLRLPRLRTLCLRLENAAMYRELARWDLPALTHLIIEEQDVYVGGVHERGVHHLFEKLGRTLETLELGRGKEKHFRQSDVVSLAVTLCPHLRQLSYYPRYAVIPSVARSAIVATGLREVCLHIGSLEELDLELFRMHMLRLIEWLRRLEELDDLALYGDWSTVLEDSELRKALDASSWKIYYRDDTV
ncbi:hypothetical protein GLOTRDRAFT_124056 [Gloeophyllum trabeum ATCC 11539]|uniref:F-box domain-containing protein n=1 Tax=Gloeophyllum trabeum (strain ATCC 11539 / FP-39264 / Madison 617) TaxID=670483 RepID=S7QPI2_GLOTA|nr:uncharacterized protein GLOTRDRAFT_124056 [Gloeophyllum trabeum ATCC 11539]EPQ61438.1 hypothetical protein GLOTRDRAFT_124056 [Gloeophyllum trabeum ATCC 11539]